MSLALESDRRTSGILRLTAAAEEQPGQAKGAAELAPHQAQEALGAVGPGSGAQSCLHPLSVATRLADLIGAIDDLATIWLDRPIDSTRTFPLASTTPG